MTPSPTPRRRRHWARCRSGNSASLVPQGVPSAFPPLRAGVPSRGVNRGQEKRTAYLRCPFRISCEQNCKPGSVFDSHLSSRGVAAAIQPPRERPGRPWGDNSPAPIPVLLRIEFTATGTLEPSGALLPHLSTLTSPEHSPAGRYLSVALFLKSPSAGVTRYPCPVEPGLSSCTAFRPGHATVCLTRADYFSLRTVRLSSEMREMALWILTLTGIRASRFFPDTSGPVPPCKMQKDGGIAPAALRRIAQFCSQLCQTFCTSSFSSRKSMSFSIFFTSSSVLSVT